MEFEVNASVKYAEVNRPGAFSNLIGWIDYESGLTLKDEDFVTVTNTIPGGYTIKFKMQFSNPLGSGEGVVSASPLVFLAAPFGNTAYIGINGYVVVCSDNLYKDNDLQLNISDIEVKNSYNQPISNYNIVIADAEITTSDNNGTEKIVITNKTSDTNFIGLIDIIPGEDKTEQNIGVFTDIGTNTVTFTGVQVGATEYKTVASPIFTMNGPTDFMVDMIGGGGNEGIAIGIIINESNITNVINNIINNIIYKKNILPPPSKEIQRVCKCGNVYYR